MDIDIIELSPRQAKFILSGVSAAFANGIRRTMLAEVPIMAIDYINIYENTSVLYDEQLALRMGLVPIKTDLSSYTLPSECSCGGEGCTQCQLSMTLSAEGPKMVYSGDLVSSDPEIVPVNDRIPVIELKEKQRIVLEAIGRLGYGSDHSKWQAGVACGYKNMPIVTINKEKCDACGECANVCPRIVFEKSNDKVIVVKNIDCSLCKLCLDECDVNALKIDEDLSSFVFTMESTGALLAEELIIESANNIKKRAEKLIEVLGEL